MVECSLSSISAMGCNFCRTGSLSFINYNECDKGIQRICFVSRHNVPSGHAHSKWSLTRYNIFVDMTYATTYFLWRTHNWNCFNAVHILDIYIALILSRQSWTRAAKEHSTVFYSLDSWKECVASSARQQVFSSPTVLHSCIVCIGMVVTPTDCNTIINACFPSECLPGRELGAKRKTTCNERCCVCGADRLQCRCTVSCWNFAGWPHWLCLGGLGSVHRFPSESLRERAWCPGLMLKMFWSRGSS